MKIKEILNIEFISKTLLCLMIFIVPIFFYPSNLHYFINIKLGIFFGVSILGVILWSIGRLKNNEFSFPKNWLSLSIFLILITSLLSSIFSENPFVSIFGAELSVFSFTGILMLFLFSLTVGSFFKEEFSSVVLFLTAYISLIIVQIISLFYLFMDNPSFNFFTTNSVNTIGKWSDLGVVSALVIILSYLIIETYKGRKSLKIIAWIGLVVSVFLAIIVSENIIWISLGLISVIYLVYKIITLRKEKDSLVNKNLPHTSIAVVLFSFLMILSGNLISNFTDSWFNINYSEIKPSAVSTFEITKNTIQNDPYLGVGVNRFERAWQQYKPDSINNTNYWGSDFYSGYSYFTSVPAQSGLFGATAWLLFIVFVIFGAIRLMLKPVESVISKKINLLSSVSILFFVVVFSIHAPSVTLIILFYIFLGLFIASLDRNNLYKVKKISIEENPKIGFLFIFSIIVLMILMIYVGYMSARQFASTMLLEKAGYALSINNKELAQRNLMSSVRIFQSDKNLRASSEYYKILISDLLSREDLNKQSTVDSFRELLGSAINFSVAAINFDNKNYVNHISLANTYEQLILLRIEGSYEEAIKSYQNALLVNPKNPGLYLDMARSSVTAGKNDEAKALINTALEKNPMFVDATFLLSQIQAKEGNINEAIKNLESTINIQPNNSNLYFQLGLLRYNKDDFEGAIASFEKAVIFNSTFANAKYFLGLSYDKVGRKDEAVLQFEDLKKMNPDNQEVQKILDNLNSGNSALSGSNESPENRDEPPVEETQEEDR